MLHSMIWPPVALVLLGSVAWGIWDWGNLPSLEEAEYKTPGESLGIPGVRFAIGGALVIKTRSGKPSKVVRDSYGQIFVMKGLDDLQ